MNDRIINVATELKVALKKVETWRDELIKLIENDFGGSVEAFSIQDILDGLKRNTDRVLEYYRVR